MATTSPIDVQKALKGMDYSPHGRDQPDQPRGGAAGSRGAGRRPPLAERALRIGEAAYGPDHPTVATRLGNLAAVLEDLGEPAAGRAGPRY
jgi:hypothetical protein